MNAGKNKKAVIYLIFSILFCFVISGCGGGGGGSALINDQSSGANAPFSLKLQMLGSTSEAPGYAMPSTAAGEVSVTVASIKEPARKVTKSASYNSSYMVFENELLANDTYSVSVSARLKTSSGDTLEIWTGSVSSFKLHDNDDLIKNPELNTVNVGLQFSRYETIQIVPSKIIFEPALPVSGLTPGAAIPAFSVKMFDQYGFAILSTSSPVAITLVNGTLLGTASAPVLNGAASFSGLTASQLIPDASGNVYLKASYGSAYGMSSPIPASIIDAPNTTVAGYLDYNLNTKASPADRAPAPGKVCSLYVDGKQYDAVTDANGFYKIDVRVNSVSSIARLSATGPSGAIESTEILLSPSKLYAALASFSAPGEGRLAIKDIGTFSGVIPADILKQQVDQKIAEIRSSSSGALAISGRVTQMRSSSADPIIGLSGVSLSISPGGQSAQTDANGFFTLNGPFAAAYYSITASKSGYQNDYTQLSIVTNDYGFIYGGMNLQMSKEVIVKYLYSVSISPSGAQLYTGGQFNLATVNAIANYSDGTSAPITPAWSIRSGGGSISGTYYTAPAAAGNVALTASHTENGITKSVDFIVTVSQQITLSSLVLSKENDAMIINGVYDLSSIKAVAYYSNDSSKEVAAVWSATNGGFISADKFTAPATEGVYILEARYSEGADTKTAGFSLLVTKPVTYEGIILMPQTGTIEVSSTYDLSLIKAWALYSNFTTREVVVTWSVTEGEGFLSGNIYTAPAAAGYYPVKAVYSENGVSHESAFVVSVINSKPVPAIQAQIISENTIRLVFSENITISNFDPSKILLNSTALTSADTIEIRPELSLSTAHLRLAADLTSAEQIEGIVAANGKGLQLLAGNGIKSAAGVEAVTASAIDIAKDTVAPPAPDSAMLSRLLFTNGQNFILALDAIQYAELSQLEFYVGETAPDSSSMPNAYEMLPVKGHAKGDVIMSEFNAFSGGSIYYRFKDRAGNLSGWSAHGVIPAPPAAENLTWTNARGAIKVSSTAVAKEGDRIFVYYSNASTPMKFKASSPAAPAGGFTPYSTIVVSDTAIEAGSTIMYSIMSPLNVESQVVSDGIIPAPPIELTGQMRLRHDLPNYGLANISDTTSVTLLNDLRITIEALPSSSTTGYAILGRILKGTVIGMGSTPSAGSYSTLESKDANGLNEYSDIGGLLKLSYVTPGTAPADGNESEFVTSVPGNGVPGPVPVQNIALQPDGMSIKIVNSAFGYEGDVIKAFEVTPAGEIIYKGSTEPAPAGGFALGAVLTIAATPITSTNTPAFAMRSKDQNEGKITKKISTAAAPEIK